MILIRGPYETSTFTINVTPGRTGTTMPAGVLVPLSPNSITPTSPKHLRDTCHWEVADIDHYGISHKDVSGFQTIATCQDGLKNSRDKSATTGFVADLSRTSRGSRRNGIWALPHLWRRRDIYFRVDFSSLNHSKSPDPLVLRLWSTCTCRLTWFNKSTCLADHLVDALMMYRHPQHPTSPNFVKGRFSVFFCGHRHTDEVDDWQ